MKLGRLNHIGVATPSIADSMAYYREVMRAVEVSEPFDMSEQGVKVCFVDTPDGGTQIELVEPLSGGRLLPFRGIRRQEGGDACFCDQRQG